MDGSRRRWGPLAVLALAMLGVGALAFQVLHSDGAPVGESPSDAASAGDPPEASAGVSPETKAFTEAVHSDLQRELVVISEQRPDHPDPPPLPTEYVLRKIHPDRLLESDFFRTIYPESVRQDPEFVRTFVGAVSALRQQRQDIIKRRDHLTGKAVSQMLQSGFRPGPFNPKAGELGSLVGNKNYSGWVPIPSDSEAYKAQGELDRWPAAALDFLSHLKSH